MTESVQLPWVVLKFRGTSVSSRSNWDNIVRILRGRESEGLRIVVVHSALSGVTDALAELLERARREREVSIEVKGELESLNVLVDEVSPEQQASAREDLRRLAGNWR